MPCTWPSQLLVPVRTSFFLRLNRTGVGVPGDTKVTGACEEPV